MSKFRIIQSVVFLCHIPSYPFCHNEHLHGIAIDQDPEDLPVHLDNRNKPILRIFITCKVIYVQKLRGGLNERYVIDSEKGRKYCKYCKHFISLNTVMFQDQARKIKKKRILSDINTCVSYPGRDHLSILTWKFNLISYLIWCHFSENVLFFWLYQS